MPRASVQPARTREPVQPASNATSEDEASSESKNANTPPVKSDDESRISNASSRAVDGNGKAQAMINAQNAPASTAVRTSKDADVDHTFALLTILFAVLGASGILYLVTRRRRPTVRIEPPRWVPLVPTDTPVVPATTERIEVRRVREIRPSPKPRRQPGPQPAPKPPNTAEQTERLTHALQALVDRMRAQSENIQPRNRPRARPTVRALRQ
ncbi:MAG TPA: hypothetical protein VFP60_03775 [Pseudolabrys sp.]|nr:hypothetical protein [Pseudolabrys sp.]